jgi:NAD(P)-dependent dehydrogenase (short-subunit alcohol dehydrogenase family)
MSIGKMQGKRVLVTGSGTGIGRGIALEMGRQGADVVLHYSASADGAESAAEQIREAGQRSTTILADFREYEPMEELAVKAAEFLGGVDVLVNNAGITNNVPFWEITPKHWDTLFSVNVRSQFFVTRALVPVMEKQDKAYVINLTSVHAFAGMTEHSVYAATKGAIVAFTREVSLELIQKGIRVNAIAPGWIRVENQERTLGDDFDWENETSVIPAGHCGAPADIANLAMFLASEESRFIIGQTIVADGGMLAIMPLTGDFRESRGVSFGKWYV